jgi:choline dehydrogenase
MRSRVTQGIAGLRYLLGNSGPLTVGAALAGGFAKTRPRLDDPDIQLFYMPFEAGDYSGKLPPISSFQISFYQNRPESRGHVRIRSAMPEEAPEIVLNYLSSETDVRTVVDGLRFIERIGSAEPLRSLGSEIQASRGLRTDEELLGYARSTASSGYHHVGSCRIGGDAFAVVDSELRVHGIGGLRIVDGSVMPTLTSGNTNAACIMIGEKGADLIKASARARPSPSSLSA